MKTLILLFFFCGQFLYAQPYILLEDLEKEYIIKQYTLNAKKMYGFDAEVEMYNLYKKNPKILMHQNDILLISILPSIENNIRWEMVSDEDIQSKILPQKDLENIFKKNPNFNQYQLVKKIDGIFYRSLYCLVQYFYVVNHSDILYTTTQNAINIGQKIITYQDVRKVYPDKNRNPMENKGEFLEFKRHIYLSKIEEINNEKAYHFWTLDDWKRGVAWGKGGDYSGYIDLPLTSVEHYNYHRGIDRFVYIKEKGIVAGSYDFYFDEIPLGFKRVVRSDMMWAKELFPEKQ